MSNPLDRDNKTNEIITLRELLSGAHYFRVPDYQRGYAWTDEFKVLWQDIRRISRTEHYKHYTGMLSLEEINQEAVLESEAITGSSAFYIVDGQQRITSFIIIISAILDYARVLLDTFDFSQYDQLLTYEHINRFGYSEKRRDNVGDFFDKRIYENDTNISCADIYMSNIDAAKLYIDNELKKLTAKEALSVLNIVLDRIVFNLYFVTPDFDVRVTFETINHRGKALSNLELLKNRLMYLSTYFPKNQALILKQAINGAWKNIYEKLCLKETLLSDDEYLKAHWIVYKGLKKTRGNTYISEILDESFSIDKGNVYNYIIAKNYKEGFDYIKEYIDSLSKYSVYWALVNCPDCAYVSVNDKELDWIKRLSRIIDALYLKAATMVVVAETTIDYGVKEKYYSRVEQFVFVNKLLAQDKNDLSFLVTPLKAFFDKKKTIKAEILTKATAELSTHSLHVDRQRVIDAIAAFKANVLDKKENLYYGWSGIRYFLYAYNESLSIDGEPIKWSELKDTSVEHVLPQTIEKEYWQIAFNDYSDAERKRITNSLGNLLLLSSVSENSSLSNFSYPVKRDIEVSTKKFSYLDGSRSAKEIAKNTHWTINEIVDRNERLVFFMINTWFADTGLNPNDIATIKETLSIDLPRKIDAEKYDQLIAKLKSVDVSQERRAVVLSNSSSEDYSLEQQFEEYVPHDIEITHTKRRISWKERFTFRITTQNDEPKMLYCGVLVDNEQYTISYNYVTNSICVCNIAREPYNYVVDFEHVPNKIKPFISSLNRYLKLSRCVSQPAIWKTNTVE